MKFIARMAALLAVSFFLSDYAALAWRAGDKVDIEYSGTWYPGSIKEMKGDQYFITYDGYDSSWDEWVGDSRLRAPEGTAETVTEEITPAVQETQTIAPTPVQNDGPQEITIRKGGSIWASIDPDGTIRVNGSIVGEVGNSGTVRVNGMLSGEIDSSGVIRKNGSIVGSIDTDGTIRCNGSMVGSIDSDGTLRNNGSIWGEASPYGGGRRNRNAVAAVLIFFAGSDFGF